MSPEHLVRIVAFFFRVSVISFGGIYSVWALAREALLGSASSGAAAVPSGGAGVPALLPGLTDADFQKIFGISQMLPGPMASGFSILGYEAGGVAAMLAVYLGLLLPGLILIPLLSGAYRRLSAFSFLRPFQRGASLAIISILIIFLAGLIRSTTGGKPENLPLFLSLAAIVSILNLRLGVRPPILMILVGVVGYFIL